METIDVLVVGAGVVGLAIARAFALQGREVVVAEREKMPGSITTARNSGVIHAGIYYKPGSLKARLCVAGIKKLYQYAAENAVTFKNCQKLIVACNENDIARLEQIKEHARANGADDLYIITGKEAAALESELTCLAALCSPSTGIIDVHELVENFIKNIENAGGMIALDNTIYSAEARDDGITVTLEDGTNIQVRLLINAAGLDAHDFARRIKGLNDKTIPRQYIAKGNYFGLSGPAPFSRLVYPVPEDGGLGVHFTLNTGGEGLFGPDVEWLAGRHEISYDVHPARADAFYGSIARFWPGIRERALTPAYAGIRPKLSGPGEEPADFMIQGAETHGIKGLVNLYGIESPGLTASMAIADYVAKLAH